MTEGAEARGAAADAGQLAPLLGMLTGPPGKVMLRILHLLNELLDTEFAAVSVLDDDGGRDVLLAADRSGELMEDLIGRHDPLEEAWCGAIVDSDVLLVNRADADDAVSDRRSTVELGLVSGGGVVLRDGDGTAIGTLCGLSRQPRDDLRDRDAALLVTLGRVASPVLEALLDVDEDGIPSPMEAVEIESLVRPILRTLAELTGLEAVYLTSVHEDLDQQVVRYSLDRGGEFAIPEGLVVPWQDTLCKRSLDEGRPTTTDVPSVWPDSVAARALGIKTYVSVAVRRADDGSLWGTLCCADPEVRPDVEAHLAALALFAQLLATELHRVERETAERADLERALDEAHRDPLTGCATRRALEPWFDHQVERLRDGEVLALAYVDVDHLKAANDRHGHAVGDAVLSTIADALHERCPEDGVVVRLGGDEFAVAARVALAGIGDLEDAVRAATTHDIPVAGGTFTTRASVGMATTTGGSAEALLAAADAAMYEQKRRRAG